MGTQVVILTGNLGKDAEMRYTPNGKPLMSFDLPIDIGYGESKETMWVRCTMFGERAEKLTPHLTKAKGVQVVGELRKPKIYDGKNGQGVSVELTISTLSFVGGAKGEGSNQAAGDSSADDKDGGIPF